MLPAETHPGGPGKGLVGLPHAATLGRPTQYMHTPSSSGWDGRSAPAVAQTDGADDADDMAGPSVPAVARTAAVDDEAGPSVGDALAAVERSREARRRARRRAEQRRATAIGQVDGQEDESEEVTDPAIGAGARFASSAHVPPVSDEPGVTEDLNSEDDISNHSTDPETDNQVFSKFDRVSKVRATWKCSLRSGVMHVDNKDYVFGKASCELHF